MILLSIMVISFYTHLLNGSVEYIVTALDGSVEYIVTALDGSVEYIVTTLDIFLCLRTT
jgi:hypothetical protein